MQIIPSSMLPERDKAALRVFLQGCRETARDKGHFQIASISLAVKHIAPLAVLESIYAPQELHFYVERAADDQALAGAEAVAAATFAGPDRFEQVQAFADELLEHTIVVGDLEQPFTGPHFFTAFSFDERVPAGSAFAPATVFLPRWQVSRAKGKYGAVANIRIDADADLEQLVERVWGAYQKFSVFNYAADERQAAASPAPALLRRRESTPQRFAEAVRAALADIEAGAYEKIVLARAIQLQADQPLQPLEVLHRLRERFSDCFTFSFGGGQGRSFIGSSPERLLSVWNGRLMTEAIAGSAPRGSSAGEDAQFARDLLDSAKDLHEHACVRDSILRRLQAVGVSASAQSAPQLLPLANVQHLRTTIEAAVGAEVHLLKILQELHPTPAVGGTPRDAAVPRIFDLEQIQRGLYAGVVGWFNHLNEGEMVVGIRSALIEDRSATLYAGAGIVEGSTPDKEMRETECKLRAMLDALR